MIRDTGLQYQGQYIKECLSTLSFAENRPYIVQPLPVKGFAITPVTGKKIRLSWDAVPDSLEPASILDRYRVYTRKGDGGFDEGLITSDNYAEIELGSFDEIYSFKVTAINNGGESFDSEILSAGLQQQGQRKCSCCKWI
ncbi:MAG: fibronectin type III domain-containing protein [Marinilabiliales bacterium]|nr:fibronectin type III domain-containing protein [Marinilabiliales bacterium]